MKYIRSTPTGSYWRMSDGRIGYVTPHYARITVLREGFRNNKWFSEPNEIGDRMYQINPKKSVVRKYGDWVTTGYEREYYANNMEGLCALKDYDERNCTPLATYKRRFKVLKDRTEWLLQFQNSCNKEYNNKYNQGFADGVDSMCDKLNKLMLNL